MNCQMTWEKRATVRSTARLVLKPTDVGYFYPRSRQPLSIHPQLEEIGEEAINYLLTQSLYKYAHDVSIVETRVVSQLIHEVISFGFDFNFPKDSIIDLYTILIDESYHAYVAYDALLQIEAHTRIHPLGFPEKIEIEIAIEESIKKIPISTHKIFKLICVCIAENTLTKEITTLLDQNETHPFFNKLLRDHMADEMRHSGIFFNLLKYIWENIDCVDKDIISDALPDFIIRYLGVSTQKYYESQILQHLGFKNHVITELLNDVYSGFSLNKNHPMLRNIINLLTKSGVLNHPAIVRNLNQKKLI